jgi:endoglucanase
VPVPPLLHDLLTAFGPSGHEGDAARVWREAASAFAEVTSDTLGTSFARVGPGDGAPALAFVGHIDEIGLAVTNVEESGVLSFVAVGGISPEPFVGARVEIRGRDGLVPGVVGRRRLSPGQTGGDRPRLELRDLFVDIGARNRDEAAALVRPGDVGVWLGEPLELPNGRLVSKALDNRLGAYVVLEAARRLADAGGLEVDVVAVAPAQEELGSYGARPAGYALNPLAAVVVDVTFASDQPGGDDAVAGRIHVGAGSAIGRGPTLNRRLTDRLVELAERDGVDHSFEVYTRRTMTDADELHLTREGIPTGLLSIPTRYIHSPGELCSLADVEACVELLVAFARSVRRGDDFLR